MKRILVLCLTLFILPLALAQPTIGAPTVYQVDLIIFKYTGSKQSEDGQWQPYQPEDMSRAIDLQASHEPEFDRSPQKFYQLLPQKFSLLNHEAQRLKHLHDCQILARFSWLQPDNAAHLVKITAGNYYDQAREIYGAVKLSKTAYQYLQFKVNLQFTEPTNEGLQSIVLQETRRILPGQISYLDTPAFGMLAKIKQIPA